MGAEAAQIAAGPSTSGWSSASRRERPGEQGLAIDALGNVDVHGSTSKPSAADLDARFLFVQTIE